MSRLPAIAKVLKETSFYHTSKLAEADLALLVKILKSWPPKMMFPGIYCTLFASTKIVSIILIRWITHWIFTVIRRKRTTELPINLLGTLVRPLQLELKWLLELVSCKLVVPSCSLLQFVQYKITWLQVQPCHSNCVTASSVASPINRDNWISLILQNFNMLLLAFRRKKNRYWRWIL